MSWGVDKIHYVSHRGVDTSVPRCNGLCSSHKEDRNYGICRKADVSGDNCFKSLNQPQKEKYILLFMNLRFYIDT